MGWAGCTDGRPADPAVATTPRNESCLPSVIRTVEIPRVGPLGLVHHPDGYVAHTRRYPAQLRLAALVVLGSFVGASVATDGLQPGCLLPHHVGRESVHRLLTAAAPPLHVHGLASLEEKIARLFDHESGSVEQESCHSRCRGYWDTRIPQGVRATRGVRETFRPGFPFCLSRMALLYTRPPPSARNSGRRTIVQLQRLSLSPR